MQIKWNEPDNYAKFEPIAGGFPFIRVIHAVLYSFLGLKDWFIKSGVISDWSADKDVKGKGNSYYRCNRLHKTRFCTISQLLVEKLTDDYSTMEKSLLSDLNKLKYEPSPELVVAII